jgi:hypothetical protein
MHFSGVTLPWEYECSPECLNPLERSLQILLIRAAVSEFANSTRQEDNQCATTFEFSSWRMGEHVS